MDQLRCTVCDATLPMPKHCGQAMHIDAINGVPALVCWMGAGCGTKPLPEHCGQPMAA